MKSCRLADVWVGVMEGTRCLLAEADISASTLAATLVERLDQAAASARDRHYAEAQVRDSLFAIVAWIDETAMMHPWAGAADWRLAPLQRHYFSTARAGVEFFHRLEALPEADTETREVFGLALLAGFTGRYATRPGGELAEYRRQCLERIALDAQIMPLDAHGALFPQPTSVDASHSRARVRRRLPGLMLIALILLPLLALGGLYLSLDRSLAERVATLMESR